MSNRKWCKQEVMQTGSDAVSPSDGSLWRCYRGRLLRVVRSEQEVREILTRYHNDNNHAGRERVVREIMVSAAGLSEACWRERGDSNFLWPVSSSCTTGSAWRRPWRTGSSLAPFVRSVPPLTRTSRRFCSAWFTVATPPATPSPSSPSTGKTLTSHKRTKREDEARFVVFHRLCLWRLRPAGFLKTASWGGGGWRWLRGTKARCGPPPTSARDTSTRPASRWPRTACCLCPPTLSPPSCPPWCRGLRWLLMVF